jgi:beta-lactamase regulating signal transducer with metallopeptidase domain
MAMTSLIESVNPLAERWAAAMTGVLWQSVLLAAIVAAVCWALGRQSPRLRYWIWLVLAAKLLLLPLWSVNISLPAWHETPAPVADVMAANAADSVASTPLEVREQPAGAPSILKPAHAMAWHARATWQTWLLFLWGSVVAGEVGRTTWQYFRLRRLLAEARPVEGAIEALVKECARTIGLAPPPAVKQVNVDGSPLVCGPLRPVLLLPAAHAARFDAQALRQVVLHELAHLRRRDLITIWIFHAMRTVYWFHPAAYWIAYRAGLERELACDQLAMSYSGATPAAYARTLIHAAGRGTQPMVLTAAGAAQLDGGARLKTVDNGDANDGAAAGKRRTQ